MEEKFRILNGEALADALQSRIAELKALIDIGSSKNSVPESLHLLLELSNEPLKNTHLSDLERLIPPSPPKELTWADIIADDPLEGEIWDDVDFAAESSDAWSGDETAVLPIRERLRRVGEEFDSTNNAKRRKKRRGDEESDDEEEYRTSRVEGLLVDGDRAGLETLKTAQYWVRGVEPTENEVDVALGGATDCMCICNHLIDYTLANIPDTVNQVWIVSELQALREVIFMLLGHPCALLKRGDGDDAFIVRIDLEVLEKRFALRHASLKGFEAVLEWFAVQGTNLNRIREFTRNKEDSPERQSFVAAVEEKVIALDKELIAIEEKYVGKSELIDAFTLADYPLMLCCLGESQVVSLLALQSQLEPLIRPFASLCRIITNLNNSSHLEQLYLAACALQSTGNMPAYNFIATIFFSCLRTYLRPIRLWMEEGLIPPASDFLIAQIEPTAEVELGNFWHSQFHLRRKPHGSLNAPSFVHPVAQRILTTGKSVVFLKLLLPTAEDAPTANYNLEITFEDVCYPGTELAPFSSLFLAAFNRWITARHHSISSRLRRHLFENCGLWKSLDALDLIFFARNGFLFESLAQGIFEKLDRKAATWNDRFLLTEQVQSVFSSAPQIESHRLRMVVRKENLFSRSTHKDTTGRKTVNSLENVEVEYRLPWPVLNIVRQDSFVTYRRVFTFLLQLRRARYLLERLSLRRRPADAEAKVFYALKQRLLWFSGVIVGYITDLVLRPLTALLKQDLGKADDVDGMVATHAAFIDKIKEHCLLGTKLAPIHKGIISILNLAVKFSRVHSAFHSQSSEETSAPGKGGRRRRRHKGQDSSDEDDEDVGYEGSAPGSPSSTGMTTILGRELDEDDEDEDDDEQARYMKRLGAIHEEVRGLVGFVKEGLRGVARAGVMPHLEMLAEALEGYGAGWNGPA